ncbi:MAG: AAA family ATPase [Legionellales bacterium]|nr:MAG: AAA family ATPase [Legionellales bacterium]
MSKIEINSQFKQALNLINKGRKNLFITGKAGTGKSTLLNYFCQKAIKKPVLLAPTGVAALNIKGQTIHSFFNFYVDVTPEKITNKEIQPKDASIYEQLETIIIDEVSMVRADLLDCIDTFLRMYGPEPDEQFGGVQMIFIGDLYQLPPIVTKEEQEIFTTYYDTPYFYSSHALKNTELEIIELEKVYRQKNVEFIELLNRIRNNSVEPTDLVYLNSRFNPKDEAKTDCFYISLTTTNKKANEINDEHLDAIKGKTYTATASIKGDFGKEYFPTATKLQFKIGAQIMLLNNEQKRKWVNGSVGVIKSVKKAGAVDGYITVCLNDSHNLVVVHPHVWEVYRFSLDGKKIISESIGTFTQYPIRLAWAITIHKSQGKTFDHVIIDIGKGTFVTGQMYVALSRCTSFEGVVLQTPIKQHHIRTDYRISRFLTNYQYEKSARTLSVEAKVEIIKQALKDKTKLDMTYLQTNNTRSQRIVIPRTIGTANYQNQEFTGLRAFCNTLKAERLFHLGRILELKKA